MKRILILGGTGAIGSYLTEKLNMLGNEVVVTSRSIHPDHENIKYILGNAQDDDFLDGLLYKSHYDAIIDFMLYSTDTFRGRYIKLLSSTNQYVFLSSSRVYAESKIPLSENSTRLLDATCDSEFLLTDEYALAKARQEDILRNSGGRNYTIIRPYISYSPDRLQLGVLEKEYWLRRVLLGLPVIFPQDMLEMTTTLTFGGDTADGICALIGDDNALGETFHVTCDKSVKWKEIIERIV